MNHRLKTANRIPVPGRMAAVSRVIPSLIAPKSCTERTAGDSARRRVAINKSKVINAIKFRPGRFERTLDTLASVGGGEVTVPAGSYVTGSLAMPSHTTLRLEDGAILLGSTNQNDYPIIRARWEGRETNCHRALISAARAEDISITGSGTIEGDKTVGALRNPQGPVVIEMIECTNVHVSGVTLKSTHMWTLHPAYCRDVQVSGVTFNTAGANSDGIDPDSCSTCSSMAVPSRPVTTTLPSNLASGRKARESGGQAKTLPLQIARLSRATRRSPWAASFRAAFAARTFPIASSSRDWPPCN